MKLNEKNLARKLRREGFSLNEIIAKTGFSKGSVSLWVRDIELTLEQKKKLSQKGLTKESIEKRRATRLNRESARRQVFIDKARKEIKKLSLKELKLIGISLYWAEGGKTKRGLVRVSNGDPKIIHLMMMFFKKVCDVPKEKFRGHIHIHHHLNIKVAENYWSSVSGIPLNQFYKTYSKPNKGSQNKRDSLPFGTFDIYICNTELFLKIKGWIEGIYQHIT
mgnify:CR=1 FL=1